MKVSRLPRLIFLDSFMTAKFFLTYGDLQVHAPESEIRDFGKEIFTPNWSINNRPIDFRNGRIPTISSPRRALENTIRIDLFLKYHTMK